MAKRQVSLEIVGDTSKYASAINKAAADTKKLEAAQKAAGQSAAKLGNEMDSGAKKATASVGGLGKGLNAIKALAPAVGGQLGSALGNVAGQAEKVSKTTAAAGVALGAVALAGGAALKFALDGASKFADLTSQVRAFQRVTGATAEDSSKLVFAVKRLGIEPEAAAKSFATLSKGIGSGKLDLAAYGVEVAHNKQGNVDLVGTVLNISKAYQATENPTIRAALANEAFKKSWVTLTPLLGKGRAELEAIFKEAGTDHQIFSQKDLETGRQYTVAISQLKAAFQGLQVEAGQAVVPTLTAITTQATGIIHSLDSAAQSAGGLGGILGQVVNVGLSPFIHSAKAGSEILHGDFKKGFADAAQSATGLVSGLIDVVTGQDGATTSSSRFADSQKRLQEAQGKVVALTLDGKTKTDDFKKAQHDAATASHDFEKGQTGVLDVLKKTGSVADQAKAALQEFQAAGDNGNQVFAAANKIYDEHAASLKKATDSAFSFFDAQFKVTDAQDALNKSMSDGKSTEEDYQKGILGIAQAAGDAAVQKLGPLATETDKTNASFGAQIYQLQALKGEYPQLAPFIDEVTQKLIDNRNAGDANNLTGAQAVAVLQNLATQYPGLKAQIDPLIASIDAQDKATQGANLTQAQAILVLQNLGTQYPQLKTQIDALITSINGIPPTKGTVVTADTFQAQTSVNTFINENNGREIRIKVNPAYGSSDPLHPFGLARGGPFPGYASGGNPNPTSPFWVGEEGPELVMPAFAGRVLSRRDSMQAVSQRVSASGGTTVQEVTNLVVNVDGGTDPARLRAVATQVFTEGLKTYARKKRS